jgi:hypothetical protein
MNGKMLADVMFTNETHKGWKLPSMAYPGSSSRAVQANRPERLGNINAFTLKRGEK